MCGVPEPLRQPARPCPWSRDCRGKTVRLTQGIFLPDVIALPVALGLARPAGEAERDVFIVWRR